MLALVCLALAETVVVVDDQDGAPDFTTTGDDWAEWSTNGYGFDGGDTSYLYTSHTVGGSDRRGTATWTPDLPAAGVYRVDTWFRRTENRTHDADHELHGSDGSVERVVVDQRGDGASDWLTLGEVACEAGRSCKVVLDADDDDESDEANAMRFVLVTEGEVEPAESDCPDALGEHTVDLWAVQAHGEGWTSVDAVEGEADGAEAHSENVDAGEHLTVGFEPCADGVLTAATLGVRARTQYDSGQYELDLELAAAGASTTFGSTSTSWSELDLPLSTWDDVQALEATVQLHDHPGGQRDSDAWVDAFRLRVTYVVEGADDEVDTADQVDTENESMGTAQPEPEPDRPDRRPRELPEAPETGCATAPGAGGATLLLVLAALRRPRREPT